MRFLERFLNVAAIVAIPVILLSGWKAVRNATASIQRWQEARMRAEVFDSITKSYDGGAVLSGSPEGGETVLEFIDYQCPACRVADSVLAVALTNGPQLRILIYHFPLDSHSRARDAAAAAVCAEWSGRFEEAHRALFATPVPASEGEFQALARGSLAVDPVGFVSCLTGARALLRIEQDIALAGRLGVRGTPTFVTRGGALRGLDYVAGLVGK